MTDRNVIIHYHLFKNAGTSLERKLQEVFGENWRQIEGESPNDRVLPDELSKFLDRNESVRAVSSHQATLPLPAGPSFVARPLVLFREPIDRVRSVYLFERRQAEGSPGAEFAAAHTFAEYVQWRLDQSRHGVIHNFQTLFLLRGCAGNGAELDSDSFERVQEQLAGLEFFGLVERFQDSIELFNEVCGDFVTLSADDAQEENVSQEEAESDRARRVQVREELGDELYHRLIARNAWDITLYQEACALFEMRMKALAHQSDAQ